MQNEGEIQALHLVLVPLDKAGKRLAAEEPDRQHAHFIEHQQGYAHHHLVDDVRGRCQNCGNYEIDQNRIFAIAVQKRYGNQPGLGQKHHHHRHLEDHPEGDKKPQGQGKILTDRRQRSKKIVVVPHQKFEGRRKYQKITKGGAGDEENRGNQGERHYHPPFMPIEAWGDKTPDLVENDRTGQQNPAYQGKF